MRDDTVSRIRMHTALAYPREACGLVIVQRGVERYIECRNIAIGAEHFVMHPEDYAAAETRGEILAVVHSHPDHPATPSIADRSACEASGLAWHIMSWPDGDMVTIEPTGYRAPLVGRPFAHGVHDCYSLVRDWFLRERGVELPNVARRDGWWNAGENLYLDHYHAEGFRLIASLSDIRVGDVILMTVADALKPNHAAVYIGDGQMLHHLYDRLSCRELYGGKWQRATHGIFRHASDPHPTNN